MTPDLTAQFEAVRPQLRAVAYRLLGSLTEADDAVQEAWLRLRRADTDAIEHVDRWLTTVTARIALDELRARRARREDPLPTHLPEPLVSRDDGVDPEHEAVLADAVGLALLVVLDTLAPAERLAFVLHDMFAVPFDEIAPIVGRSPVATRQLASRARRRVRGAPEPDADHARQRLVVDAFLAAAREGDFGALVAVLDPGVVLRVDAGPAGVQEVVGAEAVARRALGFARFAAAARPVRVNGGPGFLVQPTPGHTVAVAGFTVAGGRIVTMDLLADRARLADLEVEDLEDPT